MPAWSSERRRTEFGRLEGWAYLDHAFRGPLPERGVQALQRASEATARGVLGRDELAASASRARERLARLLGWPAEGVAFTANTTTAIASFAHALLWREGDRVLTNCDEVASNQLPWRALEARGVEVTDIPCPGGLLRPERVEEELVRGRVRVVTVAAVSLDSGQRRDLRALAELSRRHGALLCVDAAQSLGCFDLIESGADAVFGCSRKWLLGPPGAGVLALRPGVEEGLLTAFAGECSLDDGSLRPGARRFEGGAAPAVVLAGLNAALSLQEELGLEWIQERVLELSAEAARLLGGLGLQVVSAGGADRSGIVQAEVPGAPADLEAQLAARRVVARFRNGRLRVSPHFWNHEGDLEALGSALGEILA